MATSKVKYLGGLRTEAEHLRSGSIISTDAPVDNNGKGELFSPTDLVATALASCVLSIIGIYCNANGLKYENSYIEVEKIMVAEPRRIGEINLNMNFTGNGWDEETMKKILKVGKTCPVAKSLDPAIIINFKYEY